MQTIIQYISDIFANKTLKKKILFTLGMLIVYRLLVFVPVPFVHIDTLVSKTLASGGGLEFFAMLLG